MNDETEKLKAALREILAIVENNEAEGPLPDIEEVAERALREGDAS